VPTSDGEQHRPGPLQTRRASSDKSLALSRRGWVRSTLPKSPSQP
jgi:hypothetical protein